jgi:hypothetical protein
LIVHNGARLFLIREGIIGADATAQYTPDNIHNMAIIEMEKVSGLHVSKIQAMNFAELDAFALQQMHVNFAYTTNVPAGHTHDKQEERGHDGEVSCHSFESPTQDAPHSSSIRFSWQIKKLEPKRIITE